MTWYPPSGGWGKFSIGKVLHSPQQNSTEPIKEKAGGDLNIIQRTAVRLAFEQAGVDDLCGHLAE